MNENLNDSNARISKEEFESSVDPKEVKHELTQIYLELMGEFTQEAVAKTTEVPVVDEKLMNPKTKVESMPTQFEVEIDSVNAPIKETDKLVKKTEPTVAVKPVAVCKPCSKKDFDFVHEIKPLESVDVPVTKNEYTEKDNFLIQVNQVEKLDAKTDTIAFDVKKCIKVDGGACDFSTKEVNFKEKIPDVDVSGFVCKKVDAKINPVKDVYKTKMNPDDFCTDTKCLKAETSTHFNAVLSNTISTHKEVSKIINTVKHSELNVEIDTGNISKNGSVDKVSVCLANISEVKNYTSENFEIEIQNISVPKNPDPPDLALPKKDKKVQPTIDPIFMDAFSVWEAMGGPEAFANDGLIIDLKKE